MKKIIKIILTIAIIFLCLNVIAQQQHHSPNLDKFVGTWIYHESGKEMEIILRIATAKIPNQDATIDELEGVDIYKVDGKTVHDSRKSDKMALHTGLVQDRVDPNVVKFLYFDEPKGKTGNATITFIPGNPEKIAWVLNNSEGIRVHVNGQPEFDKNFSIPQSVILERKQ